MEKGKKYFSIGFLLVCVVIASFLIYNSFFKKSLPPQTRTGVQETNPAGVVFPTKTPEEIKVITNAKTAVVNITDTKIEPIILAVKTFDQAQFNNQSGKTINIVGEGWGNFPLPSGSNMTQPFSKAGKYSYKVTGLDASLTGEIIVK